MVMGDLMLLETEIGCVKMRAAPDNAAVRKP